MEDLTIIYYTANKVPHQFAESVRTILLRAAGDTPIISVSHEPISLGTNICIGVQPPSAYLIYQQVLMGAKAATTRYVATAEDDVLYPREHFTYRPPDGVFAYDVNKWSLYTWTNPPIFSKKHRRTMTSLVCERDLLVRTLEDRFAAYPDPTTVRYKHWAEPGRYEGNLKLTPVPTECFDAAASSVIFSTPEALGFGHLGTRKRHGGDRCTYLEPWGSAADMLALYHGTKTP